MPKPRTRLYRKILDYSGLLGTRKARRLFVVEWCSKAVEMWTAPRIVNHDQNLFDTIGFFQKLGPRIAHLKIAFILVYEKLQTSLFMVSEVLIA